MSAKKVIQKAREKVTGKKVRGSGSHRMTRTDKLANQAKFLAAYEVTGRLGEACRIAGISVTRHTDWMDTDPTYPERFMQSRERMIAMMEDEAKRRAIEGVRKYKFHQGRPIMHPITHEPYYEDEHSDTLLMFLLRKHDPSYRDNSVVELSGKDGGPIDSRWLVQFVDPKTT